MPSVIFSKAAAELHTTQSAVSQTMRRLEDELAHLPLLMAPRNALGEHLEAQADSQTIIDCDDDSTLLSMTAAGLGATAMPALSLESLHPLHRNVRILPLVPETKRILGYATRKEIAPQVQAFGAYLKETWGQFMTMTPDETKG